MLNLHIIFVSAMCVTTQSLWVVSLRRGEGLGNLVCLLSRRREMWLKVCVVARGGYGWRRGDGVTGETGESGESGRRECRESRGGDDREGGVGR